MSFIDNRSKALRFDVPSGRPVGIPLRDYFAGQALAAILPTTPTVESRRSDYGPQARANDYAQVAYALADAMLAVREAQS
jgi:hypothetical protein